jgi:hypothetical protein
MEKCGTEKYIDKYGVKIELLGNSQLGPCRIWRASITAKLMSSARPAAMATLTLRNNHTSTPWISFHAPRAARPENATRPVTVLIGIPE